MALAQLPVFVGTVDQDFQADRLGGPRDPFYYLVTRFPPQLYRQSPDTVLYKYMRVLLGEMGVNSLKKNSLQARLLLEEHGIELFDLDAFYGSPFKFGRILEESFTEDPTGLITREQWEIIRAKDARYRNRAQDFISGARAGNTPEGMRLIAKSGLGHDVEIIENYKFFYDVHSDDPLHLPYLGKTHSTEEFIVLPRPEISKLETQRIAVFGIPNPPNTGYFHLEFNGESTANHTYTYDETQLSGIPYNATTDHVRLALESLDQISPGDIIVNGGPGPGTPWEVTFAGSLANTNVPTLVIHNNLGYFEGSNAIPSNLIDIVVTTIQGGQEAADNVASIPDRDKYHLQQALDRIRPQASIPTVGEARGIRSRNNWKTVVASSEYSEVIRYATGTSSVIWPDDAWITAGAETVGPRAIDDLQYHYTGFHTISTVSAVSYEEGHEPADSAATYAEPLFVTSTTDNDSLINGIYPLQFQNLSGVSGIVTRNGWWSSGFSTEDEVLELDLGVTQAINYLSFELINKPLTVNVDYDTLDSSEDRAYVPVLPLQPYNNRLANDATDQNVWTSMGLSFANGRGDMIFTRRLRLVFKREADYEGTILVRNLRVARNIT